MTAGTKSTTTLPNDPCAASLWAVSDAGGEPTAAIYSLIGTAKLHGLDPDAYLRNVMSRIAKCERYGGEVAENLFRSGICLPSSSSLSESDQLYVINEVRKAARAPELLVQRVEG